MDFHFLSILGIWAVLTLVWWKLFDVFTKHKDTEPNDLFDESIEVYIMTALMVILFILLPTLYSMYLIPE